MNDLTLYQIADEYRGLLELAADEEADEESFNAALTALQGSFHEKAVAVAQVARNLECLKDGIEAAATAMLARAKRAERRADAVRAYLLEQMVATGIGKIESPYFALAVQKNPPRVWIEDENLLPPEFRRTIPARWEPDKSAILKALKEGENVVGCRLEATMRLKIK